MDWSLLPAGSTVILDTHNIAYRYVASKTGLWHAVGRFVLDSLRRGNKVLAVFDGVQQDRPEWYKNGRPKIDIDWMTLREFSGACGASVVVSEVNEADHTIAWLVRNMQAPVTVISSDKDFIPLLGECTLISPEKGRIDGSYVLKRYGVPYHRFSEYLMLAGDKSDRVKGVPGIGPKRAAKLIAEHATLEAIEASIGTIDADTKRMVSLDGATPPTIATGAQDLHRLARYPFSDTLTGLSADLDEYIAAAALFYERPRQEPPPPSEEQSTEPASEGKAYHAFHHHA